MGNFGVKDNLCKVDMDDWLKGKLNGIIEVRTLLWTNPSPSASFPAQYVNVNLSAYDFVEILFSSGDFVEKFATPKTKGSSVSRRVGMTIYDIVGESYTLDFYFRDVSLANSTGVRFYAAEEMESGGVNNTYLIPYRIYGIKEVDLTV